MLLLMVNLSFLIWIAVEVHKSRPRRGWPQDELDQLEVGWIPDGTMFWAATLSSALTFIWLTQRINRPILMGAIGGILGLVTLFGVYSLVLGVHYFVYYEGGDEYVEDGAFMGLVIVPIILMVAGSPVLAAVGALIGGVFWASQAVTRRRRSKKTDVGQST
jgi:hypothetical protein